MADRWRRPILGAYGVPVVGAACAYELFAIVAGKPVPTISQVVRHHRVCAVVLLAALSHHWLFEGEEP